MARGRDLLNIDANLAHNDRVERSIDVLPLVLEHLVDKLDVDRARPFETHAQRHLPRPLSFFEKERCPDVLPAGVTYVSDDGKRFVNLRVPTATLSDNILVYDADEVERIKTEMEEERSSKIKLVGPLGKLRDYFFTGTLVTAPIAITIWLALAVVDYFDKSVIPLIPAGWNPETYLPFGIPGFSGLAAVCVLSLMSFVLQRVGRGDRKQ